MAVKAALVAMPKLYYPRSANPGGRRHNDAVTVTDPQLVEALRPVQDPELHRSIVDSTFDAWIVDDGPTVGGHASVITEVEGSAYRTGESVFSLDARDPLGTGFLLR